MTQPEDDARSHQPLTVVVSGDVTVDWNLARETLSPSDGLNADTRASWQRGGAALLADLLATIASDLGSDAGSVTVHAVEAPTDPIPPGDDGLNHSYAVWSRFPGERGTKHSETVWRVEDFLGVDRARSEAAVSAEWQHLRVKLPDADIVVLDDAGLGFRDHSDRDLWRGAFADRRPWVVLKQASPVAHGPLWEHLLTEAADRLVVVLTIDDLRGREIQVSRALSWERTAQDLLWELINKPDVNALSRVAHTVVSFGLAGAIHLAPSGSDGASECTLHFDPELVEGDWDAAHAGKIMGGTDCLTTALVREILLDGENPQIRRGIGAGVAAARRLHLNGYEQRGPGRMEIGFPLSSVVEQMTAGPGPLQMVPVPDTAGAEQHHWTILQDRCTGDLAAKAAEIAHEGAERALEGVPLGRFANLVTADRSEIEAFHGVASLIAEYANEPPSKPLSIGVFGPPGSGKSFGVKQVANSVAGDRMSKPLEFNLSQLRSLDDLADAFHLVRDKALAGEIPLVFWDEFDTPLEGRPLGWLRYFLAPMQDGEFRQGQLTHPIGSSIFVFAGGTCSRVEDFGRDLIHGSGPDADDTALRQAKGPDFVSRLKGFVNVLGPNAQGEDDPYYVIRRAILLRSILHRNAPQLFDGKKLRIDPGVLRGFLETTTFRHGARSLEAVVTTSQLSGKTTFERSSLPPSPQLDLHVHAQDFLALVQRPDLEGELLERLARAAHHVFRTDLEAKGYTLGEVDDPDRKKSDSLVDYDNLSEFKRKENRDNVRDIPTKLSELGCLMVPAGSNPAATDFTNEEIEILARAEHERWMRDLGPGWRHGVPTDKPRKISEAYVPWDDLPDEQKDKDRNLVRQIPTILHEAGYAMVRIGRTHREPA